MVGISACPGARGRDLTDSIAPFRVACVLTVDFSVEDGFQERRTGRRRFRAAPQVVERVHQYLGIVDAAEQRLYPPEVVEDALMPPDARLGGQFDRVTKLFHRNSGLVRSVREVDRRCTLHRGDRFAAAAGDAIPDRLDPGPLEQWPGQPTIGPSVIGERVAERLELQLFKRFDHPAPRRTLSLTNGVPGVVPLGRGRRG